VIVDNRSGAGGSLGADVVAKSPPDGYTCCSATRVRSPSTPICAAICNTIPCGPGSGYPDHRRADGARRASVIAGAFGERSRAPGQGQSRTAQLRFGGIGNLQHLAMESLQSMAHIKMNHVPYKGAAPAFIDLLSGQVDLMFANIVGVLPHIWAKKVRPSPFPLPRLAGAARRPRDCGDAAAIRSRRLDGDFRARRCAARDHRQDAQGHRRRVGNKDFRERFSKRGAQVTVGGPEGLARIIREETVLYAKIIKSAGIKPSSLERISKRPRPEEH